jgi:predicted nucleic acid-binding protein
MSGEFCDTNILVYAYDTSAGTKRELAKSLLDRLWREGSGVLSVQVLQELFVTLTRKVPQPLAAHDARAVVADFASWRVVEPAASDVLAAIDVSERWRLSFWDAMIVRAAQRADATVLWSEDLASGQAYDGVSVRDPFGA